uniref:Phosphomevalonate kinase n=1 Tax=Rhabditophanes sp. KR3021 TaxID=114890 RepID=A0AC35UC89_9BILA
MVLIVCMSGKRKSGKDFTCVLLAKMISDRDIPVEIRSISHPLKEEFAKENNLDAAELKTSSLYKEAYRRRMVVWGEQKRKQNPHFFCEKTMSVNSKADVIIISDCRRQTDLEFFISRYENNVVKVRVIAGDESRKLRGYEYTSEIDDADTECGLDNWINWDVKVLNNEISVEPQAYPLDGYLSIVVSKVFNLLEKGILS